jgi:hypothetical protein
MEAAESPPSLLPVRRLLVAVDESFRPCQQQTGNGRHGLAQA